MLSSSKLAALAFATFLGAACVSAATRPWWSELVAQAETRRMLADQRSRITRAHAANEGINAAIARALSQAPSASRVRVGMIHGGDGTSPLRTDTTHIAAAPGAEPGEFLAGRPISQWESYMAAFLAGRCVLVDVRDPGLNEAARTRLRLLRVGASLGCPLVSGNGDLLGGVFLNWDDAGRLPGDTGPAFAALRDAAREIAPLVPDLY